MDTYIRQIDFRLATLAKKHIQECDDDVVYSVVLAISGDILLVS
jgi:hypothetical protein